MTTAMVRLRHYTAFALKVRGRRLDLPPDPHILQRTLNHSSHALPQPIPEQESLTRALKALNDPTRRRVLDLLMTGTHCNCELAENLGLSLSLVSHHLRVLTDCGLVQSERCTDDARWIHYHVCPDAVRELTSALNGLLDVTRLTDRHPVCPVRSRRSSSGRKGRRA
jgi:ArsR family transcriptional regulator